MIDIKLGTVLYDESASPDKVKRMEETARNTTSLTTGVRLTGFQVYDNASKQINRIPKSFGKSIKPSDLPSGITHAFPSSTSTAPPPPAHPSIEAHADGVPTPLLIRVLERIIPEVKGLAEALKRTEMRMVGGSLLIAWEGDALALEQALNSSEREGEEGEKKVYAVKLIDFAHTRPVIGKGPDEGVVKGMQTAIELLEGRLAVLQEEVQGSS